jgi:ribosomal protein L7/L12
MRWINLEIKIDMPKLRLKEWKVKEADLFRQRVSMIGVIVENTKLGLKVSKDISDGLLENKEAVIEVEDLEKATDFAEKLRNFGVLVEIEQD